MGHIGLATKTAHYWANAGVVFGGRMRRGIAFETSYREKVEINQNYKVTLIN